jgi:UDP-N-acetylglucosamine 2-epimerase (non-hydrolysing)
MIHIIIGTKAQLIKMAPVLLALRSEGLPYRFISTGQHRETMDDILDNFGLDGPDYRLYVGADITSIPAMAVWSLRILWQTLTRRREIFGDDRNGIVLVHGDTFSTLLGALMARLAGLKVGHVESGLRSYHLFHPFPEELIRLLTFRLTHYFFCPGPWALSNLVDYPGNKIDTLGNTLADALRFALSAPVMAELVIPDMPFAVVTLHRFENIYSRTALERIVGIVERISQTQHLIFILHKPTENKLQGFGLYPRLAELDNVELRQRYDFFRFIRLIESAEFVISDGGSNQEECHYLGKPILLLRKATERREGLGENCLLSSYNQELIDRFVADYRSHSRAPQAQQCSPSQIIAQTCRQFA